MMPHILAMEGHQLNLERQKTLDPVREICHFSSSMATFFSSFQALVLLFDLVALALAVIAVSLSKARKVSSMHSWDDMFYQGDDDVYCSYDFDAASGLGISAFVLLFASRILLCTFTKCLCCGSGLHHGCAKVSAIVLFIISWITFVIAELFLWAVSTNFGYYKASDATSCRAVRRVVFGFGAAFILITAILSMAYSVCYKKAAL